MTQSVGDTIEDATTLLAWRFCGNYEISVPARWRVGFERLDQLVTYESQCRVALGIGRRMMYSGAPAQTEVQIWAETR